MYIVYESGIAAHFFVLHVEIEGDLIKFEYVVSRGEAYDKKNIEKLRRRDVR